ncbi:MAG: hypothetical protein ACW99A_01480 [Candidatus Kariarchaeaceae archaeon]
MSSSRLVFTLSLLIVILIIPSNNFTFVNDQAPNFTTIPDLGEVSKVNEVVSSQIKLNGQPWGEMDVVPSGLYTDHVAALDTVYDGSTYHVIYALGDPFDTPADVRRVYYTNYSGSVWSTPIVIFDGSQGDYWGNTYSTVDSLALEYSMVTSTFYLAINTYYSGGHNRVLYLESKTTISNITSSVFDVTILGTAFHRPENIRLAIYGDTVMLGYEVWVSLNGARPYAITKNETFNPNFGVSKLIANNTETIPGDLHFEDIVYSDTSSKFLVIVRNSTAPKTEQNQIFESNDGLGSVWTENTVFGNLPTNPDGIAVASIEEFNNELYTTYSIVGDKIELVGQFNDLVITKTESGQVLPYLELISDRAALSPVSLSKTIFVNGNIVVIAIIRPDVVSHCNCEKTIVKMFTSSGNDIQTPSPLSLTNQLDQTILNNQSHSIFWPVIGGFGYYNIYRNRSMIKLGNYDYWGSWVSGETIEFIDYARLPAGLYNFTILVFDTEGNFVRDTVWITSNIAPLSIGSSNAFDSTIFVGESTGDAAPRPVWHIYGGLPGNYDIYRNNTIVQQGTFTYSQIRTNYWHYLNDGPILLAGIYNYTIYVSDTSGAFYTDTLWVTVKYHVPLTASSPRDHIYEIGENFELSWDVTGESTYFPLTFSISSNGSQSYYPRVGGWKDGDTITVTDTALFVGVYNYTLELRNGTHTVVDSVFITVVDSVLDSISFPDYIIMYSNQTHNLIWEVESTLYGTYEVYKNDIVYLQGDWADGDIVTISIGPLPSGDYVFTVYIMSSIGGSAIFTISVSVIDPIITETSTESTITTKKSTSTSTSSIEQTTSNPTQQSNSTANDRSGGSSLPAFTYFIFGGSLFMMIIVRKRRV